MKPRITIGTAILPDGARMELIQHDQDFMLAINREVLMSTRVRLSEEILANIGLACLPDAGSVLIGGLGMGFTLRQALQLLPGNGRILQAELVPEIVAWNRGPLAAKNGGVLNDARVTIEEGDVAAILRRSDYAFDAIILDVDNGPSAMVKAGNSWLYSNAGLDAAFHALKSKGRLTVWSADDDVAFRRRLRRAGFRESIERVRGSHGKGGPRHVIFVADKSE